MPTNLRRLFYVSWEDALWDLLANFKIENTSVCLVPDFFCMDVVKNMEQHGLRCVFYPLDSQLQIKPAVFAQYLRNHRTSVVVILHVNGITSSLFSQNPTWLKDLPKNALLIEDSVHRLVDPNKIRLLHPNHFFIDSLRKVAPLYGSNLYGDATTLQNFRQSAWWLTLPYQIQIFWWWWLFQFFLQVSAFPISSNWKCWCNLQAQHFMQKGYDLIGDSQRGATGPWFFNFISQFLTINAIEKVKKTQVDRYQLLLTNHWSTSVIYKLHFDQTDAGKLRGFPVGITLTCADQILPMLQKHQLAWKYELDDCPWSKRQKIIYLPLGPHIHLTDIDIICAKLISILNATTSKHL